MSAGLLRNSIKGAASAAPFFPTLLDQMPNAIVVFKAENNQLIYANPAAESALDVSRKSIEGHSVHDVFGDNQVLTGMIEEAMTNFPTSRLIPMIIMGNDAAENIAIRPMTE